MTGPGTASGPVVVQAIGRQHPLLKNHPPLLTRWYESPHPESKLVLHQMVGDHPTPPSDPALRDSPYPGGPAGGPEKLLHEQLIRTEDYHGIGTNSIDRYSRRL